MSEEPVIKSNFNEIPMEGSRALLRTVSPEVYTCVACFCPCFLIGNMTTKIHRELPFPCFKCSICFDFEIGVRGCESCCWACIGASILWPCSPLFGCYLARERWKLKLFYKDDDRLKPGSWFTSVCWPANLRDQHRFIREVWDDGSLTFSWDFEEYRDQMIQRPDYLSYTLFIFGPDSFGESEFLRKLMVLADKELDIEVNNPELKLVEKIRTATKPLPTEKGMIRMMDIWRIPPSKHRSGGLRKLLTNAAITIFLLDLNVPDKLQSVKDAYEYQTDFLVCAKLIVIVKAMPGVVHENAKRIEEETINWARKTTCVWFVISLEHEAEFFKINKELNKLLRREKEELVTSSSREMHSIIFNARPSPKSSPLVLGAPQRTPTSSSPHYQPRGFFSQPFAGEHDEHSDLIEHNNMRPPSS